MKVCKFGGTSLASAEQMQKVASVVKADNERKIVVVSAPGKRFKEDIKVTDLLISLADTALSKQDITKPLRLVIARYEQIANELKLSNEIVDIIQADLDERLAAKGVNEQEFIDLLKASGEDNNAKLFAFYLVTLGLNAHYIDPKKAGLLVSKEYGNAQVLPEAYDNLYELRKKEGILIFPGFFGYTHEGTLVTFPRGGSDITGSIVAAGVKAELYENFTDVDSVYVANPNVVEDPVGIKELTYREMRELSYAGFSVFHDEALIPAFRKGIPVCIKNTNNPAARGTMVVNKRDYMVNPVVGIASDSGFSTIYVRKYLMNREVGFGRHLLEILEDEGLSYEHMPSGIDDTSVIVRGSQLTAEIEARIISRIEKELDADDVHIEHDFAMVMIVGEGMQKMVGISAKATAALARGGVNIHMINQGSSEVSMVFGVKSADANKAVIELYNDFFAKVKNPVL